MRKPAGVEIDKKPKRNSVAQTGESGSGLGHVAWVKSASKDGKRFVVEEYNCKKDKYAVRTVGVRSLSGISTWSEDWADGWMYGCMDECNGMERSGRVEWLDDRRV